MSSPYFSKDSLILKKSTLMTPLISEYNSNWNTDATNNFNGVRPPAPFLKFKSESKELRLRSRKFTSLIPENKILKIPISHGEGNYQADNNTLNTLLENNQIAFQYCDKDGNISKES